jgi:hypothetical protein
MIRTLSLKYCSYSVGDLQPSRWTIPIGIPDTPSVDNECGERYPNPETTAVPLQILLEMPVFLGRRRLL